MSRREKADSNSCTQIPLLQSWSSGHRRHCGEPPFSRWGQPPRAPCRSGARSEKHWGALAEIWGSGSEDRTRGGGETDQAAVTPFLSSPYDLPQSLSWGGGGVDSTPGRPNGPCAGSQPGRGLVLHGGPLEGPRGTGERPDTSHGRKAVRALPGPLTHIPPLP